MAPSLVLASLALALSAFIPIACTSPAPPLTRISLFSLEIAPPRRPQHPVRRIVSDAARLGDMLRPLNDQIALVEVHTPQQWRRLCELAPPAGPPPDFSRGMVVGVLCRAGVPLDGAWPASIAAVRVFNEAGLLVASFTSGCYLPDATAYLETAYVEGLKVVLVVDVDSVRFYPD